MINYLGGYYLSGFRMPGSRSTIHLRVAKCLPCPFVLESFAFISDPLVRAIRHNRQRIFLDSGAFSMHTRHARVNLRRYAAFIRDHHDIIAHAANIDAISPANEELSYDRQKALETLLAPDGLDHLLMPVHHLRDHDVWLQRYLDDGYRYIGLGGLVSENKKTVQRWLDYVWREFLTNPNGTPKVKVHAFGLSSPRLVYRYPWASVDSSTWWQVSRFGGVLMDVRRADGSFVDIKVNFSDRQSTSPQHYRWLHPDDKKLVDRRLEQLEDARIRDPELEADFKAALGVPMGFNPIALGRCYGLRDLANIGYYSRMMDRT
jgi:hypothetical protein